MERLWAPWRAPYVLGQDAAADAGSPPTARDTPRGCVFCTQPARGAQHFAEHLILCMAAHAFVIMNLYPYNSGHIMVVPRLHVASPLHLPPDERDAFFRLVMSSLAALGEAVEPEGINMGMNLGEIAGAGIAQHCHMHLVPRWKADNNFMPVLADTRVISQSLAATYATLLPHFAALADTGAP